MYPPAQSIVTSLLSTIFIYTVHSSLNLCTTQFEQYLYVHYIYFHDPITAHPSVYSLSLMADELLFISHSGILSILQNFDYLKTIDNRKLPSQTFFKPS